jgi:hypothetical protein
MTAAYTPTQRLRISLIAGLFPLALALVGIAVLLSLDDLPAQVAVHWDASGRADRFGSLAESTILIGALSTGFAVLATLVTISLKAGTGRSYVPKVLVATSVWLSAFLVLGIGGTVWMQRGIVDAAQSPSPTLPLFIAFVVALPLAAAAWIATPAPVTLPAPESETPALELGVDERVLWVRTATPAASFVVVVVIGALVCVGGALVGTFVGGQAVIPIVIAPAVVVVLAAATLFWRVRVDGRGVVTRSALGLPRFVVPIAEISEAHAIELSPLREFGGWGLRVGTQGRLGIVLRAGEALEIHRHDGRVLAITVDDAATAAALVNGLVRRATLTR